MKVLVALTAGVAGELSGMRVLGRDGSAMGTLAPPEGARVTAFGFTVAGARLYVEWAGTWETPRRFFTTVHRLDEPGFPIHATYTFKHGDDIDSVALPVARGDHVVLAPWKRVLRYDASASSLEAVTGLGHGSMRAILPRSGAEVIARVAENVDGARYKRIAFPDAPPPAAPEMFNWMRPNADHIIAAAKKFVS